MINEKEKEKKIKERKRKTNLATLTGSLHYCTLPSKEFLLFPIVPVLIEMVAPVRTAIAICLIVLQSIPPGCSIDMGQGYNDDDWLHRSSLSQRLMW